MYVLYFLAKKNLKKKKGDVAVLLILTSLATLLLYTSISALTQTSQVIEAAFEKAHTAHLFFMTNAGHQEEIKEILTRQPETVEYECSPCIYARDTSYRKDLKEDKIDFSFVIGNGEEERTIGCLGEQAKEMAYEDILMPYYMKSSVSIGDHFYLTLEEKEFEFVVAGYTEDPLFATPLNMSSYSVYISQDYWEKILKECPDLEKSMYQQHKVRLRDGASSADFDEKVSPILAKEIPELSNTVNVGMNGETMISGVAMMSNISMGVILIFSMLLLAVAWMIVWFDVRNFMERNLKNIGIQKASGFTLRQLSMVSIFESSLISVSGIVIGLMLGAASARLIGQIQGVMLGLSWNQGFSFVAAISSGAFVFLNVAAATAGAFRSYRKLTVLDALRGGIYSHNFRKNHLSLEKSRLPLPLALACKYVLGEKKKNLSVFLIVVLLSFATCTGFGMYQNFALDTDYLKRMVGIETGNVLLSGEEMTKTGAELETWEEVEQILYYNSASVHISNGEKEHTLNCDIWKEPKLLENEMLLRGRLPEYENEIVLSAGAARQLGVELGDAVYVEGASERLLYLVSGIDQKINNLGIKSMMNEKGARRLNSMSQDEELYTMLYLFTREGVTYQQMEEKLQKEYPKLSVSDSEKMTKEALAGVSACMFGICMIFVLITFFVVILVEVLLVSTKILREQKNYGISKALGYTAGQLMCQTVLMHMPAVTAGTFIGILMGNLLASPLVVFFLTGVGIEEYEMALHPIWICLTAVGIPLAAAVSCSLASIRIRKMEPVKLLSTE